MYVFLLCRKNKKKGKHFQHCVKRHFFLSFLIDTLITWSCLCSHYINILFVVGPRVQVSFFFIICKLRFMSAYFILEYVVENNMTPGLIPTVGNIFILPLLYCIIYCIFFITVTMTICFFCSTLLYNHIIVIFSNVKIRF